MKVPVDEVNIVVGREGLVLLTHAQRAVVERLIPRGMAELLNRMLEAERWEKRLKFIRRTLDRRLRAWNGARALGSQLRKSDG